MGQHLFTLVYGDIHHLQLSGQQNFGLINEEFMGIVAGILSS